MDIPKELLKTAKGVLGTQRTINVWRDKVDVKFVSDVEDIDLDDLLYDYENSVDIPSEYKVSGKWVGKPSIEKKGEDWIVTGTIEFLIEMKVPDDSFFEQKIKKSIGKQG